MQYKIEMMRFNDLKEKAVVNNFQRRLVWSEKEKFEFIETLKEGYPFGSILIYKYKDLEKFSIIDGLQRFSTIEDYKEKPHKYCRDIDDFVNRISDHIVDDTMSNNTINNYKKQIEKGINIFFESENRSYNSLYNILCDNELLKEKIEEVNEYIYKQQEEVVKHVNEYLDINSIQIPCIEFTGNETDLATVFQNLNRGGKKLSKYQVFSAQWSKYETVLSKDKYNEKILEIIIDRYTTLINNRNIDILDFDEHTMRKERKINLSEFCYALGKLIIEEMNVFWSNSGLSRSDPNQEDLSNEIGYSTLGIVLSVSNNKLHKIPEFKEFFNNPKEIEDLVEKILNEFKMLNNYFKKYLKIPGIHHNEKYESSAATNFQILSFFASLWVTKYEYQNSSGKIKERQGYKRRYNKIRENLIYYFINDIVNGRWSGTGDKKLNEIYIEKILRYSNDLDQNALENNIVSWNDELTKNASVRFSPITKLLYVVYLSLNINVHNQPSYDYEHIFPKKRYEESYKREELPLGSLGNIMLLESSLNRSKKDNHILGNKKNISSLSKDFLEIHEYPNTNILNKLNEDFRAEDFISIKTSIKTRANKIITNLVDSLYKSM